MPQPSFELYQKLLSLGFSKKEALVYLASLELGSGTTAQIARRAGVNRTTAYTILDSLVSKSLVAISGKEPTQLYVANPPTALTEYMDKKIATLQNESKEVTALIPQLVTIHNARGKPKVSFYEGKEGLMHAYDDTLSSTETIRAYASVKEMSEALPEYFPKYFFRRADKKIKIKAIFPNTPEARELTKDNKIQLRETLIVDNCNLSTEINIYDNKVMIASWKEKLGIIIESTEIANDLKQIFDLSWNTHTHTRKTKTP